MNINCLTAFLRNRRARVRDYAGLTLLCLLLMINPIRTGTLRTAFVMLVVIVWGYGLILFWRNFAARIGYFSLLAVALALLLAPGHAYNKEQLRVEYIRNLRSYTAVKYVWGGENGLGIDCSGLVREGLIIASIKQGIATLNPCLIRLGGSIWWHDCTANALGEGYGGRTRLLFTTESLSGMDYAKVQQGDIAVTDSGVHTMAYVGNSTWIEADPGVGYVIQVKAPGSKNVWFNTSMKILRWRALPAPPRLSKRKVSSR